MSKSILIISYFYPPTGSVSMFKVAKFTKYLSKLDWDVFVLTVDQDPRDPSTVHFPEIRQIPRNIYEVSDRFSNLIGYNDALFWTAPSTLKAVEIINKQNIDIVFQTASPHMPLLGIPYIKYKTNIPIVIDFRDAWKYSVKNSPNKNPSRFAWSLITNYSEPRVLRSADVAIMNSPGMKSKYQSHYNGITKFDHISNGWDPEDYEGITPNYSDKFTIIYPGKFRDDIDGVIKGIKEFMGDHDDSRFIHFGRRNSDINQRAYDSFSTHQFGDKFEAKGYHSFQTIISHIKGANVGLALSKEEEIGHVPRKFFDYVACDIPILGVGPSGGSLESLCSEFPNAYFATRDSKKQIREILKRIKNQEIDSLGKSNRNKYRSDVLTEKLAAILEEAISNN